MILYNKNKYYENEDERNNIDLNHYNFKKVKLLVYRSTIEEYELYVNEEYLKLNKFNEYVLNDNYFIYYDIALQKSYIKYYKNNNVYNIQLEKKDEEDMNEIYLV